MSQDHILIAAQISVITYALVAGVFLAFSDFVLASLSEVRQAGGIQAMQIINRRVMRTIFMVLLIGMSVVSPLLVAYALFGETGRAGPWIAAGGTIYFVGTFLVTMVFNVPMNIRLDRLDLESVEAADHWQHFVSRWGFWNWVRAIAAALAAACLLIATVVLASG
ncbi:DUF1772 domain-containing protein [Roseovarius sp. Pro17]|uniref:anthrone oxygenase family protein n=1 Tax=Roseovarius sp. Pro17 TaxID=3108175 RepID=UPI002D7782A1|nr:anthrone oxygenase family protein [Roseovarius sp. Pro17]